MSTERQLKIAIVGAGASGYFAAISAAERAKELNSPIEIQLFESANEGLKKVKISGGGRCNVTHECFEPNELCQSYPRGNRELRSPMNQFQPRDTIEWFRKRGVDIVAEPDGRMFPSTNKSTTIIECFKNEAKRLGVQLLSEHSVREIKRLKSGQFELTINNRPTACCDALLISTGSAPIGYQLAKGLGHDTTPLAPSLFSFVIKDPMLAELPGTSLPRAGVTLEIEGAKNFQETGPILVTHWGLSGPAILKLSAWAAREMKMASYQARLVVNWLGSKKYSEIEQTLNAIKQQSPKSIVANAFPKELTKRFWGQVVEKCGLDLQQLWANVSKKEITQIVESLCKDEYRVTGKNRYKDEFVECGGIDLKQVDLKTLESKLCKNLYFAGEILDIDGITGGFNFQSAWTTGWIAGRNMVLSAGR